MRTAAFAAGALVAAGAYLAIAAAFAFSTAAIAVGIVAIGLVAAVGVVIGDRRSSVNGPQHLADPFDFA